MEDHKDPKRKCSVSEYGETENDGKKRESRESQRMHGNLEQGTGRLQRWTEVIVGRN